MPEKDIKPGVGAGNGPASGGTEGQAAVGGGTSDGGVSTESYYDDWGTWPPFNPLEPVYPLGAYTEADHVVVWLRPNPVMNAQGGLRFDTMSAFSDGNLWYETPVTVDMSLSYAAKRQAIADYMRANFKYIGLMAFDHELDIYIANF